MRNLALVIGLALGAGAVAIAPVHAAVQCDALQLLPPRNTDRTFTGKLDAAVDGWFSKLAKVDGGAEGTYRDVSTYVLEQFPQADKLYVWERVIYLKCQLIAGSADLSTKDKLEAVDQLLTQFNSPPPANSISNSGNNATIIQGDHNTVNKP